MQSNKNIILSWTTKQRRSCYVHRGEDSALFLGKIEMN